MQNAFDLQVTTVARSLASAVYRATQSFPSAERFGLTAQMRRAVVSIGSNIAEGCGRSGDRELVQFLHIALGSASELEFQTWIATDLQFLRETAASPLLSEVARLKKMLARFIKALKSRGAESRSKR
jgi:four helix bundle protein